MNLNKKISTSSSSLQNSKHKPLQTNHHSKYKPSQKRDSSLTTCKKKQTHQNLNTVYLNFLKKYQFNDKYHTKHHTPIKIKQNQLDQNLIRIMHSQKNKKWNSGYKQKSIRLGLYDGYDILKVSQISSNKKDNGKQNKKQIVEQENVIMKTVLEYCEKICKQNYIFLSQIEQKVKNYELRLRDIDINVRNMIGEINKLNICTKQNIVLKQLTKQLQKKINHLKKQSKNIKQEQQLEYLKNTLNKLKNTNNSMNKIPSDRSDIQKKILIKQNLQLKKYIQQLQLQKIQHLKLLSKIHKPTSSKSNILPSNTNNQQFIILSQNRQKYLIKIPQQINNPINTNNSKK